jgi:type VI secretion system secreted protein VgrG
MSGDERDATIKLPIGGAALERFTASESLSEPYSIEVLVLCRDIGVDFFPHLGAPASIKVSADGEPVRWFHGLIFEAEFLEETASGFRHRLLLRPWLHMLGRNRTYVIHQDKSVVDILKIVFDGAGGDVDYGRLQGDYAPRDYCVQFRESDLAFVSRLMEDEGIYYFFDHQEDRHVLTLCDGRASHDTAYDSLAFRSSEGAARSYQDRLWRWNERVQTGGEGEVRLRNFDFKRPDQPRKGEFAEGERLGSESAEVFDYPSAFLEPDEGATRGRMILEAARRQRRSYAGQGDALSLACGKLVTVADHPVDRLNQEYLVTRLVYGLEGQSFRSGDGGGEPVVALEATPADTPWRAPFSTPRPVVRGPETAVVTGPDGEVIFTDEYGRIKVRFHWDRGDSAPDKSTCWIRVSHPSAGSGGLGNIILPRIGQEVIVDFLDGDPDRPIVTGRVYNQRHMQTYALPEHKTRSVWRSQTIGKTGSYSGAEEPPKNDPGGNEIRMEDKGGQEEVWVHAQRDMRSWVRLDEDHKVGRDKTRRVGRDRKTAIKRHEALTVEEGDETRVVDKGKRTTTIEKNEDLTVRKGDMSIAVKKGDYSLKTDKGSVTIEAKRKITLKVGSNSIVIDQQGVTIKGMMVKIQAKTTLSAQGMMTDLKGTAMTVIKGGVVLIN